MSNLPRERGRGKPRNAVKMTKVRNFQAGTASGARGWEAGIHPCPEH